MTWEIADRAHPTRAGSRFDQLARVMDEVERCEPRDRFYVRWVGKGQQTETPTDGGIVVDVDDREDCRREVERELAGEVGALEEVMPTD